MALRSGETISGFELGRALGEGASSVVFSASRAGRRYALKLTKAGGGVDAGELSGRFRREAAALARLNHPGLVKVLELGDWAGQPYLAMEEVAGETLEVVLERGPLAEAELLKVARSLASSLVEVQRHALVHRDIKPSNIIVLADGSTKLLDFGFAAATRELEQQPAVGTLLYAAPEQSGVLQRLVDGRSDLYSLGCVLFHCATGRPPFLAPTVSELLTQQASAAPPSPRGLNPAVHPALEQLLFKLLAKDPEDRYQTARGLLADLERFDQLRAESDTAGKATLGARDHLPQLGGTTPMVGRAAALATLRSRWERARRAGLTTAAIEGPTGCGKSRLALALLESLEGEAQVLTARCQEADARPLAPLRELVEGLLAQGRDALVRKAAGDEGPILAALSPRLARVLGAPVAQGQLDAGVEEQRFRERLAHFLVELARGLGPTVLQLEDVQWLDAASIEVLGKMAPLAAGVPLLLLLTARNDEGLSGRLDALLAAAKVGDVERVTLEPLDDHEVGQLLTVLLGGVPLDAAVAEKISRAAQGNAFAVQEYVYALLERGALRPVDGRWELDAGTQWESLALSEDVVGLVAGRVSRLPPDCVALLRLAAVLTTPAFEPGLLGELAGISPRRAAELLEHASSANVLQPNPGGGVSFAHQAMRRALLQPLDGEAVADLHQRVADGLSRTAATDSVAVYALAHHVAHGHAAKAPEQVYRTSLAAGLLAVREYAYELARESLERARAAAATLTVPESERLELLENLSLTYAARNQQDEAAQMLDEALAGTSSPLARARLQNQLASVRRQQERISDALEVNALANRSLGAPVPQGQGRIMLAALWLFLLLLVLRKTGLGFGKARGDERKRRQLHHQALAELGKLAFFTGNLPLILYVPLRERLNAHFLGLSPEFAEAEFQFSFLPATMNLRAPTLASLERGIATARQLGNPYLEYLGRCYGVLTAFWVNDQDYSERSHREGIEGAIKWCMPGDTAMHFLVPAAHQMFKGDAKGAVQHITRYLPDLERCRPGDFARAYGMLYSQLMLLGRTREALEYRAKQLAVSSKLKVTPFVHAYDHIHPMQVLLEQEDFGPELDAAIDGFTKVVIETGAEEFYNRYGYQLLGYIRLAQAERGSPDERATARGLLRKALKLFKSRATSPVHGCHYLVLQAGLARLEGRTQKAAKLLARAEQQAAEGRSSWGRFALLRERARLWRTRDPHLSQRSATEALQLAQHERWKGRVAQLRAEFGLDVTGGSLDASMPDSRTTSLADVSSQRVTEALLQVSLASASSLDSTAQARAALDTLIRILGAQRAFLLALEPGKTELSHQLGRDSTGADLPALTGFSTTVVKRVVSDRKGVVVTGTDEGEALGSASAVLHNLRSIIAAPLLLRDQLMGVVYLDSQLAKGLFSEKDLSLLQAVANHIAIAIETRKQAHLEAERRALQRDLALTSAMQQLLLPRTPTLQGPGWALTSRYRPASSSGGDWWWCESQRAHPRIFLGDVTGHGPAPAMLTAAVAGALKSMMQFKADAPVPECLQMWNRVVAELTSGEHWVAMSALEYDPATRKAEAFLAGVPPLLVLQANGAVASKQAPGRPLGGDQAQFGQVELTLQPGERLLMFTDGLNEMKQPNGRPLGLRLLGQLFAKTRALPLDEAAASLMKQLDEARRDTEQEDDMTFVILEAL
ncbi:MAG: SpoIIE family protein phosphatase [Archangiaceae bacterium]|nr:SpoIIE family protein phosphatase [Archangiaceae bacterium]